MLASICADTVSARMSFRPDSPLNRLVILWPGVPIAACALGFVLAGLENFPNPSGGVAAPGIFLGFGPGFIIRLLFSRFFILVVEGSGPPPGVVRPAVGP